MRSPALALAALGLAMLAIAGPASAASKNVQHLDTLPEAKNATAINFLEYSRPGRRHARDRPLRAEVVLARRTRRNPALLDEVTAEDLRLQGDPPVDFSPDAAPFSTFWQNEDMDVDQQRKLALLSRDPRAYAGSTTREPGEPDPNGATNIAGVYVVDAKDPARPAAAELPAAAHRPHDHLRQRLQVALDGRPRQHQPSARRARLDLRAADHRHRPEQPAPARRPTRCSRSTCSAATA